MRIAALAMLGLIAGFTTQASAAGSYAELVQQLQSGDTGIDYTALRYAYAETPSFDPYAKSPIDKRQLVNAVNSGKLGDALSMANTILATNYTDLEAHYASFLVYDMRGDMERAEFHRTIVRNLLKSIGDSGDGMSEDSAIEVVSQAEEYSFLGLRGYQVQRTGLVPSTKGPVDAVAVTTPDNQGTTFYFDIRRIVAKIKPPSDTLPPATP